MLFLIRHDSDGPTPDAGIAAQQRFARFGAVLFEFSGVHDARDDLAHVVLLAGIARKNAVNLFGGMERLARLYVAERRWIWRADFINDCADAPDARVVVRFPKIHGAANLRVHFRSAEIFGGSFLPDGRL